MTLLTKSLSITEMNETGSGLALIANLNEVDNDGDTYEVGAFDWVQGGQWASMVTSHNWTQRPFGKARVFEDGAAAYAELKLNLDTAEGRDWHAALKFDLATGKPVQEWSYGYDVLKSAERQQGLNRVRVLQQLKVIEVSPVLRGAGKGTRTLDVKGLALKEAPFAGLIADLQGMADALSGDPGQLSANGFKQLDTIHATIGKALEAMSRDKSGEPCPISEDAFARHVFDQVKHRLGE